MKNLHKKGPKSLDKGSPGIGQHLRAARKATGLSSVVAAGRLGMTHTTLNAYENDKREPRSSDLAKMVALYRRPIQDIFYGAEAGPVAVIPQQIPVRGKFVNRERFDVDFSRKAEESLPILTIHPRVYAVKVVGNTMGPTAFDGEYLILEKPEAGQYMELSAPAGGLELVQGESVGKVVGVFRRPR